jgi:hypothetical protein
MNSKSQQGSNAPRSVSSQQTNKAIEGSLEGLLSALDRSEQMRHQLAPVATSLAEAAVQAQNETADPVAHKRLEGAYQRARRAGIILENL